MMVLQMMFLALTLSEDERGLDWGSRKDSCGFAGGAFFWALHLSPERSRTSRHTRFCINAGDERTCEDYDAVEDDTEVVDAAEDDFGAAGALSATSLTFTLVEMAVVLLAAFFGGKVAVPRLARSKTAECTSIYRGCRGSDEPLFNF
eukprot:scaffold1696_cov258-Pinguiococcus_pyrenoidosus.AAC.21